MNKTLILFFALLISTFSFAQIKTGGGNSAEIEATITILTSTLKENDVKCPSSGQRLSKDTDIMQIYLKLSLLKNTEPKSAACEEATFYLACVNDKAVRKIARKLQAANKNSDYLARKYKVPQSEVDKMILFFSTLGAIPGEESAYDSEDF